MTEENEQLAADFAERIVNIHEVIIKQHSWAFNKLTDTLAKSIQVPDILLVDKTLFNLPKERGYNNDTNN